MTSRSMDDGCDDGDTRVDDLSMCPTESDINDNGGDKVLLRVVDTNQSEVVSTYICGEGNIKDSCHPSTLLDNDAASLSPQNGVGNHGRERKRSSEDLKKFQKRERDRERRAKAREVERVRKMAGNGSQGSTSLTAAAIQRPAESPENLALYHPLLGVGTKVMCRDASGVSRLAEIIERRVVGRSRSFSLINNYNQVRQESFSDANIENCDGVDTGSSVDRKLECDASSEIEIQQNSSSTMPRPATPGLDGVGGDGRDRAVSWASCRSEGDVNMGNIAAVTDNDCGSTAEVRYYVHYISFNRRLDEWVTESRIDIDSVPELIRPVSALSLSLIPQSPSIGSQQKLSLTVPPNVVASVSRGIGDPIKVTRTMKRKLGEIASDVPIADMAPGERTMTAAYALMEKEHEEITKVKNVNKIEIGDYEVDTWYFSPFPPQYACDKLYLCEFCLKFMKRPSTLARHSLKCDVRHPPGNEIYRYDDETRHISFFEIDGRRHRVYCQNLCLIAKLFLDHKTLYYDVDPFLFYVLTEVDSRGCRIVGYFSKEKESEANNVLACILILPQHQRKGYGRLLISLAYELSKLEGKIGSPEKPLSDLGQLSFRSYWTSVILDALVDCRGRSVTLDDLSAITFLKMDDVIATLQALDMVKHYKGQHVLSIRSSVVDEHDSRRRARGPCHPLAYTTIDLARLRWIPGRQRNDSISDGSGFVTNDYRRPNRKK